MANLVNHPETLRDLKRIIVRHKWRFIVPCFLVAQLVLLGGLLMPRSYEAQAIFERRDDLVMSEIAGRGAPQSFAMLKKSLVEELSGYPAIEQLIDDLSLDIDAGRGAAPAQMQRQDLLHAIRRRVQVHYDISTAQVDRIRVVYIDADPDRARNVVNRLVSNYITHARHEIDDMLVQAADFFEKQVGSYRQRIDELEDQKLRYEIDHADLLPAEAAGTQTHLAEVEASLAESKRILESRQRRIERLRAEIEAVRDAPASIIKGKNPQISVAETELREYRKRLDHALTIEKMTERHPTVIGLRARIVEIERAIAVMPDEVVKERIFGDSAKQTQLELSLLKAEEERDQAQREVALHEAKLAQYHEATAAVFPVRAEYRRLERAIEDDQRQLTFWEDNLRRVKMALTAELGQRGINLAFIKPSGAIQRPSSPDLMQVLFAAMVLGIVAGVGCVLFADRTDQSITTLEQANRSLGVPIIGAVQEIVTRRHARLRLISKSVAYPVVLAVFAASLGGGAYLNYLSLRKPYMLAEVLGQPSLSRLLGGDRPGDEASTAVTSMPPSGAASSPDAPVAPAVPVAPASTPAPTNGPKDAASPRIMTTSSPWPALRRFGMKVEASQTSKTPAITPDRSRPALDPAVAANIATALP